MKHIRHWLAIALEATVQRGHPDFAGCCGCGRDRVRQDTGAESWCSLCAGIVTTPAVLVFPREVRGLSWDDYAVVVERHGVTLGAS